MCEGGGVVQVAVPRSVGCKVANVLVVEAVANIFARPGSAATARTFRPEAAGRLLWRWCLPRVTFAIFFVAV